MGLDTSHDCWHGPYSSFGTWRSAVFDAAYGGGPRERYEYLKLMDAVDKTDPLFVLLNHSDCDGEIAVEHLLPLAARLEELLPKLETRPWLGPREDAQRFIAGLRAAHAAGEPVEFH